MWIYYRSIPWIPRRKILNIWESYGWVITNKRICRLGDIIDLVERKGPRDDGGQRRWESVCGHNEAVDMMDEEEGNATMVPAARTKRRASQPIVQYDTRDAIAIGPAHPVCHQHASPPQTHSAHPLHAWWNMLYYIIIPWMVSPLARRVIRNCRPN